MPIENKNLRGRKILRPHIIKIRLQAKWMLWNVNILSRWSVLVMTLKNYSALNLKNHLPFQLIFQLFFIRGKDTNDWILLAFFSPNYISYFKKKQMITALVKGHIFCDLFFLILGLLFLSCSFTVIQIWKKGNKERSAIWLTANANGNQLSPKRLQWSVNNDINHNRKQKSVHFHI